MRGFKVSRVETEIYKFLDGRSFISQEKQVGKAGEPGAHGGTHFLLYGKDKGWMREIIFRENREANGGVNRCVQCWAEVIENVTYGSAAHYGGEWDHIRSKPAERCDCSSNGRVLCFFCHKGKHVSVRWTKREEVQV